MCVKLTKELRSVASVKAPDCGVPVSASSLRIATFRPQLS